MKNSIQPLFLAFVFLIVLLNGCAPASTPSIPIPPTYIPSPILPTYTSLPPTLTPVPTPTLWPDPSNIVDSNNRLNHTVNLANAYEIWSNGEWSIMSDKYFDLISSAGFTAVRIPIEFSSHSLSADPYTIDPSFMKTVDWVVKTSNDYGLVAIIDMHNYWDLMSDPNNQSERFLTLWKQISEHYQSYPNGQVYFELLNEPNGNLDSAKWNKLLAKAIMIVRQTNPVRPIIIDGEADWDPSGSLGGLRLPDDPNLIVTFHYYKPKEFTHQGADWISGAHSWLGTTWDGTPQETAVIASDFNWVANWAKNNNRPIFMGEFGALSTASQASRVRWTTAMRIAAEQRDFSWGYWDFCTRMPGFGVYDIDAQVWLNDLLQALIPNP